MARHPRIRSAHDAFKFTRAFLAGAAERTEAFLEAGAFLAGGLGRLVDRGLATEPLIAFEDFAMVLAQRNRQGSATTERSLPPF